jgi:hypothetical protein
MNEYKGLIKVHCKVVSKTFQSSFITLQSYGTKTILLIFLELGNKICMLSKNKSLKY